MIYTKLPMQKEAIDTFGLMATFGESARLLRISGEK
jgi:hypothetical protein